MNAKHMGINIYKYILIVPLLGLLLFLDSRISSGDRVFLYIAFSYLTFIGVLDFFISVKKKKEHPDDKTQIEEEATLMGDEDKIAGIKKVLKQKEEELEALRATSEIFTYDFDTNIIVEHIYKVFSQFAKCDRVLVCFMSKDSNALICKHELGKCILGTVGKVIMQDAIIIKCFESRSVVVVTNEFIQSRSVYGDKIAIPLNISNEKAGIILMETIIPGTFSTIDKGFLESLSNYAAVAIKNAELFTSLQLQKDEIEALYEQTAAVNEELNSYIKDLNEAKEELKIKNDELTQYYDDIQTGYLQTVMTLANVIEAKDPYTRGHCQRVMEISCEIATRLGLTDEEIGDLRYAAILHDIGKIGVSATILNKDGKLTDEEYSEIKKHPAISYSILKDIEFIQNGLSGILQHHERYDGKGYPNGIRGDEISIFGRILCIADAFDAMTSDRPYRKGMSMEDAVNEIIRCRGSQFDPEIASVFIRMTYEILYGVSPEKAGLIL